MQHLMYRDNHHTKLHAVIRHVRYGILCLKPLLGRAAAVAELPMLNFDTICTS